MIRKLLILPVVLLCLVACERTGEGQRHDPVDTTDAGPPVGDFYKRYEGTIAGMEVVVHLHRYGHEVHGSYQYRSTGRPVTLADWEDTTDDAALLLTEIIREDDTTDQKNPRWSLRLTGGGATGTWTSGDEATTRDIRLREAYTAGSYRLDALAFSDTVRLFAGRHHPRAHVTYGVVMPPGDLNGPDRDFLAAALGRQLRFDRPEQTTDFRAGLTQRARRYFDQYLSELNGLVDSNAASETLESFIYEYYATEYVYVLYNDNGWVVLEDIAGEYTGGAHGNSGSSFLNLDLQGNKAWALTDIVSDTLALIPQLEAAARDYFKLRPGEEYSDRVLVPRIPPTRNCYLTPTGIAFVYNPYEIASYADGEVYLFLPYNRLLPLLTPAFRSRMGLQDRSGIAMR